MTSLNFKDQVEKIRQNTNYVSIVHYYKYAGILFIYADGISQGLVKDIDTWVNEFNGVFRIGAVDCDDFPKVCADQGVKVFPTVKIYPPVPIPATDLTVIISSNFSNKSPLIRFRKSHQNTYIAILFK